MTAQPSTSASAGLAGDESLLDLAAAPPAQRRPNLLLAAVHYLLLGGADDPLADHYPTVAEWRGPAGRPRRRTTGTRSTTFAAFCRRHRDELAGLLAHAGDPDQRGRPLRGAAARRSPPSPPAAGRPLALVDLGASAGLNLLFDRYAYRYGDGRTGVRGRRRAPVADAGDAGSPVALDCERPCRRPARPRAATRRLARRDRPPSGRRRRRR